MRSRLPGLRAEEATVAQLMSRTADTTVHGLGMKDQTSGSTRPWQPILQPGKYGQLLKTKTVPWKQCEGNCSCLSGDPAFER